METNFENKEFQVLVNLERLKEENSRYHEIKSRIGIIVVFYTIFSAYTVQLFKYGLDKNNFGKTYFYVFGFLFLACFIVSIINSIKLLLPQEVAHKDLPKIFYNDMKDQYLENGINPEEVQYYIRETYLNQIEVAVEENFSLNNKKSSNHYYSFLFVLIALIPYIVCVGIVLTSPNNEKIYKVNIVTHQNMDTENTNNSDNNNDNNDSSSEPVIDTSQVIQREPVRIKESKDAPSKDTTKEE